MRRCLGFEDSEYDGGAAGDSTEAMSSLALVGRPKVCVWLLGTSREHLAREDGAVRLNSRETAERWPRAGRELAESWPGDGRGAAEVQPR